MHILDKIARTAVLSPVRKVIRIANERKCDAIHLFVLSPPLSGSTVIAELLNTSPHVTIFPGNVEGQLLPESRGVLFCDRRWDPNLQIDWVRVRNIFNSYWSPFKTIRLEKSPPHITRARELERAFMNSYFLITIRNPYAQVEGLLRRKWQNFRPIPSAPLTPTTAAEFWVRTAKYQIYNLRHLKNTLFFTYEELTDNPDKVVKEIISFLPKIGSIDIKRRFSAHNVTSKPIKGLKNLNQEKIDKLTEAEIEKINMALSQHQDVLRAFKYNLIQ